MSSSACLRSSWFVSVSRYCGTASARCCGQLCIENATLGAAWGSAGHGPTPRYRIRMPANFKAGLVGCFGQPVTENPTGAMQEAAFEALGLNWRYLTVEVKPGDLGNAMLGVRAFGMQGVNLTTPHKVSVIEYLDETAPDAAIIGAVNTVRREGDKLIGENTDGKGFLCGVRTEAGVDPKGKRVVVLGAGGAARAIVTELALAGASDVLVVNRFVERGEQMAAELASSTNAPIRFQAWQG